jgi:hypothetical protein
MLMLMISRNSASRSLQEHDDLHKDEKSDTLDDAATRKQSITFFVTVEGPWCLVRLSEEVLVFQRQSELRKVQGLSYGWKPDATVLERVAIADWYDELFLTKIFELKGTAVYFKHSAGQVHLLLPTTSLLPRKSDHTII